MDFHFQGAGLNRGTDNQTSSNASPETGRFSTPLTVHAVLYDLDGTITKSYQSWLAVDVAREGLVQRGCKPKVADTLIDYVGGRKPVRGRNLTPQEPLHMRRVVYAAMRQLGEDHGISHLVSDPTLRESTRQALDEGFTTHPGAIELIRLVRDQGPFQAIYTATPAHFAQRRISIAGVQASDLDAVWAKQNPELDPGYKKQQARISDNMAALAQITIPYEWKKPNDTPLRELNNLGIAPANILYIGEGKSDLMTVFMDPQNPKAVFAFQAQGAKSICDRQRTMNDAIRPGSEDLGAATVETAIDKLGVRSKIIDMKDGFHSILELYRQGKIEFAKPDLPAIPYVQNGKLIAAADGQPSGMSPFRDGSSRLTPAVAFSAMAVVNAGPSA